MTSTKFLMGVSLAAFAAGTASAQTYTGTSTIIQQTLPQPGGTQNTATVNNASTSTADTSYVEQRGSANVAQVDQFGAGTEGDDSEIRQFGNSNYAQHYQDGDGNFASTRQGVAGTLTSDNNQSLVVQIGEDNSTSVVQVGDLNRNTVASGGAPCGDICVVISTPVNRNINSVDQQGNSHTSRIEQRTEAGGPQASDNSATVIMRGDNNSSTIQQFSRGNVAIVAIQGGGAVNTGTDAAPNTSFIRQSSGAVGFTGADTAATNPLANNVARNAMGGAGNLSEVTQNGRDNNSQNAITAGGADNYAAAAPAAFTDPGYNADANNAAAVTGRSTNAREGNYNRVQQSGTNLRSDVVIGSRTAARGRGNQVYVNQGQLGVSTARNHTADVWTRGVLELVQVTQRDGPNTADYTAAGNSRTDPGELATVIGRNLTPHAVASISTDADRTTVIVDQTGDNYGAVTVGGGAGRSAGNGFAADPRGDNRVQLTQTDAGDFTTTVTPATPGGSVPNDPSNPFDNTTNPGTGAVTTTERARNDARLVTNGYQNDTVVEQNGRALTATSFQEGRTRNNSSVIRQGMNMAGAQPFGSAFEDADNPTFTSQRDNVAANRTEGNQGAPGVGTSERLTANITQGNFAGGTAAERDANATTYVPVNSANNDAYIVQDGTRLSATIVQRGTGGAGAEFATDGTSLRNLVIISQTGNENRATAVQTANVGPSGTSLATNPQSGRNAAQNAALGQGNGDDEFFFAGGQRSAEIRILQASFGNSATVEQRGKGQRARIEQSGNSNTAGILQEAAATNATAVIRQTGNGNSFYITQTQAGQYSVVTQSGNNNDAALSNIIDRGLSTYSPNTPPAFTTNP